MYVDVTDSGVITPDEITQLNFFPVQIDRSALRIAALEVRQREEALDLVQESLLKLAEKYLSKPMEQWAPLYLPDSAEQDPRLVPAARRLRQFFGVAMEYSTEGAEDLLWLVADSAPDSASDRN